MDGNEIKAIVKTVAEEVSAQSITLKKAQKISQRVREKASEMGVKAVVAITDAGAHPILIECEDGAYIASYDIALNKAFTVVSLKISTAELKKLAQPGASLYGIQFTNNGRIVVFGGGVPIMKNGRIIGGIGVSGGSEEQDSVLADYGAQIFPEIL